MVNLIHWKNRDQCWIVLNEGLACVYEFMPKKNNENNDQTSIFTSSNFKEKEKYSAYLKIKN